MFLAFGLVEEGRDKSGIAEMRDALIGSLHALSFRDKVRFLTLLALALGKVGESDQGLKKIDEALTIAKQVKKFGDVYLTHLFKGQLLLMKNASGLRKAKQAFSTAVEIAREQNAKSDELRATIPLAKLLAEQGHRNRARTMLAEIYNWFTEGFDTADLKDAKGLLDDLSD